MYGRESNYPPPSTRHPRGRARKGALLFLEGGEIGSFTLGSCSCRRLIADESANDSIITAKLWRQVSLAGGKKREGRASAYFPNANGRNNPYFTSRWHRVLVHGRRLFLSLAPLASRKEASLFAKFSRQFSAALCRGEREKARGRLEVDLIGAALSEFLIRHISFRASFRATNVKRNEVEMVPRVENSD